MIFAAFSGTNIYLSHNARYCTKCIEGENMKKVSKSTVAGAVISAALAIISFAVIPYYKSGITEYNSILDKYLNLFTITFIVVSTVAIAAFGIICAVCFIVIVLRRNKMKKKTLKTISAVLIAVFLVINIVPHIGIAVIQANESNVIDSVTESADRYVRFDSVFDKSDTSDYREQTEFKKICDSIPVNYEVQLSGDSKHVFTECIYITKPDLMTRYYNEQRERYSIFGIVDFSDDELKAMNCDEGFYYTQDNTTDVVVIKGDAIFHINLWGQQGINENLMQQIAAL